MEDIGSFIDRIVSQEKVHGKRLRALIEQSDLGDALRDIQDTMLRSYEPEQVGSISGEDFRSLIKEYSEKLVFMSNEDQGQVADLLLAVGEQLLLDADALARCDVPSKQIYYLLRALPRDVALRFIHEYGIQPVSYVRMLTEPRERGKTEERLKHLAQACALSPDIEFSHGFHLAMCADPPRSLQIAEAALEDGFKPTHAASLASTSTPTASFETARFLKNAHNNLFSDSQVVRLATSKNFLLSLEIALQLTSRGFSGYDGVHIGTTDNPQLSKEVALQAVEYGFDFTHATAISCGADRVNTLQKAHFLITLDGSPFSKDEIVKMVRYPQRAAEPLELLARHGYRFPDVEAPPTKEDKLLLRAFKIVRKVRGGQQPEFLSLFLDRDQQRQATRQIAKESRRGEWHLQSLEAFAFPCMEGPRSRATPEQDAKLVELGQILLSPDASCRARAHQLVLKWLKPLVADYVGHEDTSRAEAAMDMLVQVGTNFNPYKLFERDGATQWYSAVDYVQSSFRRFEISYQKKSLSLPTRQAIRRYYSIRKQHRDAGDEPTADLLLAQLKEEGVLDADLEGVRGFLASISNESLDVAAR